MKKLNFLALSLLVGLCFSCNPIDLGNNGSDNYWYSSTLTRIQLKDKVKTVTYGEYTDYYNESGFITKSTYTANDGVSTTIYNYQSNGKLTSTDFSSTMGTGTSYSTTFEYGNTNKFVVEHPYHLMHSGLVPELKAVRNQWENVDYVFNGNTMWLITSYTVENTTYRDTTTVLYNEKYPVSMNNSSNSSYVKDITYATNGMFLRLTEGSTGDDYLNESKYYFRPDNQYLLVDSVSRRIQSGNQTTVSKIIYKYDNQKNVILETYSNGDQTDYSYQYDSHNNWTTKTTREKLAGSTSWQTISVENRTITYW